MHCQGFVPFIFFTFLFYSCHQAAGSSLLLKPSSFSIALENLQKQINYTFDNIGLLRRAMTHASYSEENNKALSILGENVISTSVAMREIVKNIDISSKDLSDQIAEVSKVDTGCAVDGMHLGLQKIVRVSPKTDSSTSSVVCGAFRATFGAISVDSGSTDYAGRLLLNIYKGGGGGVVLPSK